MFQRVSQTNPVSIQFQLCRMFHGVVVQKKEGRNVDSIIHRRSTGFMNNSNKPDSSRGCSAMDQDPISSVQFLFNFNSIECSTVTWYRGNNKEKLIAWFTGGQLDSSPGIHEQFQGRLNQLGDNDPGIEIDDVTVGDGGEYLAEVNFTDQSGALQSLQVMSKIRVPQLSVGESPKSLGVVSWTW